MKGFLYYICGKKLEYKIFLTASAKNQKMLEASYDTKSKCSYISLKHDA
jgi:hypothetical protein